MNLNIEHVYRGVMMIDTFPLRVSIKLELPGGKTFFFFSHKFGHQSVGIDQSDSLANKVLSHSGKLMSELSHVSSIVALHGKNIFLNSEIRTDPLARSLSADAE